jgi:cell division septum initiation protein DivIVA|tara:strand:- start:1746 stop:1976 length:231 start_codon:yes stop_codon:yes gene_type:complete
MINKSEIDKQLDFLQKDRVQVQTRLDQASDEIQQLERTLANLDGAIQVSNHYLSMIENKVEDGTIKSSKSDKKVKK